MTERQDVVALRDAVLRTWNYKYSGSTLIPASERRARVEAQLAEAIAAAERRGAEAYATDMVPLMDDEIRRKQVYREKADEMLARAEDAEGLVRALAEALGAFARDELGCCPLGPCPEWNEHAAPCPLADPRLAAVLGNER